MRPKRTGNTYHARRAEAEAKAAKDAARKAKAASKRKSAKGGK